MFIYMLISFFSYCYNKIPLQKGFKGESICSGSQVKVQHVGSQAREPEAAGHVAAH